MAFQGNIEAELDPAAMAIFTSILDELRDTKEKLTLLTNENEGLRQQLSNYVSGSPGNSPMRRKQAKLSQENLSANETDIRDRTNSGVCGDGPGHSKVPAGIIHNTKDSTGVSNKIFKNGNNGNKKKIIQVIESDIVAVRKSIKDANCKQFSLKQVNANAPIKIAVTQSDEVPLILNALKNSKISFHEYKLDSEKSKCYIIRGLVGVTCDCVSDIHNELISAGIPAESVLSIFTTGYMRANPSTGHSSLLKLVVPPNFDEQVLKEIKFIDHVAVSFEKLKSKPVLQCKNCQRFGHSAGGCQHRHRCVKCGANHFRDSCPRTLNKSVKLVCCNCGGEHSANNLSMCAYFQKNFVKLPSVQKPQLSEVIKPNPVVTINGVAGSSRQHALSFAAIAGSSGRKNLVPADSRQTVPNINLNDISKKLDLIMQMVSRHEELLQKLHYNE